jgi:hypothetical protein
MKCPHCGALIAQRQEKATLAAVAVCTSRVAESRDGWATTKEVAAQLGISTGSAWSRLGILSDGGYLESREVQGRRGERLLWRLAMSRNAR